MFAAERIRKIKEILLEYKHVDVNTLCSLLSCSIATVRRDLDKLETEGFLTKAYGGAILNESPDQHIVIAGTDDPYLDNKAEAAHIAASTIADGDIIFLGAGTTCLQIAPLLSSKKNLTVVTNNLSAAVELSAFPAINAISLGGDIRSEKSGNIFTEGQQTISALSGMFIDKAFFSVNGISMEFGLTVSNYSHMQILQTVIRQSSESFIVADVSKFGQRSMVKLAEITDIPNIITNVEISSVYKEFLFNNNVKLFTSFEKE